MKTAEIFVATVTLISTAVASAEPWHDPFADDEPTRPIVEPQSNSTPPTPPLPHRTETFETPSIQLAVPDECLAAKGPMPRVSRAKGVALANEMIHGELAPLYEASSVMGATRAAGGYSALSEAIRATDVVVLLSGYHRGVVPENILALMSAEEDRAARVVHARKMIGDFLAYEGLMMFAESVGVIPGSNAAQLIGQFRAFVRNKRGDFADFLESKVRSLKAATRVRVKMCLMEELSAVSIIDLDGEYVLSFPNLAATDQKTTRTTKTTK